MGVRENIAAVRERIEATLARTGRGPDEVTIVAVTKTFGPAMVDEVVRAGVVDVGENRIQEFLDKSDGVTTKPRWHLVGHLQRNKVRRAIGRFHLVHSVDSVRLAEAIDRVGGEAGVRTAVLLQVNTSGEDAKSGFGPQDLAAAAARIAQLPHIDLRGLMTIGPTSMDRVGTRACFRSLREQREFLRDATGLPLPELSMGMTGDFEIALEEGATILRLGRIITGERAAG